MKFLLISIILQITSYSFALKPHNSNLKLQHNNINITSNNHYKSSKNLLNMCVNIPNDITTIDIDNTHNYVIGHSIPSTSLTTNNKHHTAHPHHTTHNNITNNKPFYYRFIPKKLIVISIIIIWYILSTLYNISNKKSIEFLRGFPYTLAMIQMAVGAFIILSKDMVQILYTYIPHIPYTSYIHPNKQPPSPLPLPRPKRTYSQTINHYKRLIVKYKEPAIYHTLSHTTTVLALNYGTLSFTQLIKGM